jgi:hypothetical protein
MLRICYSETEPRKQWTLCGQLAGPWVHEFRSAWRQAPQTTNEWRTVVDLSDVTFIDENGETLLAEMRSAGVEFVAAGVETRYLLDNLKSREKRPLRRILGRLNNVYNPCDGPQITKDTIKEGRDK